MVGRKLSDFEKGLILFIISGVLAWAGTTLLSADKLPTQIEALQEEADNNRESINELINLHLQK